MRKIKFRAWDHFNKVFAASYDKINGSEISITFDGALIISGRDGYYDLEFKRYTIQQFTGLEDRNGKEIYEGDILQVLGAGKCPVVWDRYFFDLDNYDQYSMDNQFSAFYNLEPQEMTVIGNIFENPDLIPL